MACSPDWKQAPHHRPGSALQGQQGHVEPSALCTGYGKGPKGERKSFKGIHKPTHGSFTVWALLAAPCPRKKRWRNELTNAGWVLLACLLLTWLLPHSLPSSGSLQKVSFTCLQWAGSTPDLWLYTGIKGTATGMQSIRLWQCWAVTDGARLVVGTASSIEKVNHDAVHLKLLDTVCQLY